MTLPTAAEVAIVAAARAKGADAKTLQAIKQRAALMISKLQAAGVGIPQPKVYDTKVKDSSVEINQPQRPNTQIPPQISRGR